MRKICIISFAALLMLSLISCGKPKTALSADEFQSKMEEAGFEVFDILDQLSVDDGYESYETALTAINEGAGYQIDFRVADDENGATRVCNNLERNFKEEKGNSSSESSVSLSNYSKYTLTSGGRYYVVSRIGNTLIYVDTISENKDAVNGALTALGY